MQRYVWQRVAPPSLLPPGSQGCAPRDLSMARGRELYEGHLSRSSSTLQLVAQLFQCSCQPDPRCSLADTEQLGDLGVRIPFDLLQDQHRAEMIRERVHSRLKPVT